MKKKVTVFFVCLLLLASCIKQETITTIFTFSSNGVQVSGNTYTASYKRDSVSGSHNFTANLYVGAKSNNNYIQINYSGAGYITPGTYNNGGIFSYIVDSTTYSETTGSLTISQIDTIAHKMSGNFQFSALNPAVTPSSLTITNGSFTALAYQVQ